MISEFGCNDNDSWFEQFLYTNMAVCPGFGSDTYANAYIYIYIYIYTYIHCEVIFKPEFNINLHCRASVVRDKEYRIEMLVDLKSSKNMC